MDIGPRKSVALIAVATAIAGVILAFMLLARGWTARASAQVEGSASPRFAEVVPQPTSPLQIVSVTPVTPEPPPGMRADVAADLKAYNVVLKNVTRQDVILYALQLTSVNVAQKEAPAGGHFAARFGTGPGKPAVAAGQTKFDKVTLPWRGAVAVRVDVVALGDGTVYGKDMSLAFNEFVESIDTRRAVMRGILSTLEAQGPQETERQLKEQLPYLDEQLAKYTSPNWVD